MTADQERLKFEHRDRVADACALAIRHAALLLDPTIQKFAEEIIANNDSTKLQARKRRAVGGDLSLILALEKLSRLRMTHAWVRQGHYIELLTDLWCGVAQGAGPLETAEQEYQAKVVKPLIEGSFRTLWAAQAELKKQKVAACI